MAIKNIKPFKYSYGIHSVTHEEGEKLVLSGLKISYMEKGRKSRDVTIDGKLLAFGEIYFIVTYGDNYFIYNEDGDLVKTLPHSIGKLCGVSSDSFSVENERKFDLYNMNGELVGSKPYEKD